MKETKKPLEKILQTAHIAFFGGLILLLLCLLLAAGGPTEGWALAFCCVTGTAVCFGGTFYALICFRCPHCGASLMAGGRMPMSVPAYCSGCGAKLDEKE